MISSSIVIDNRYKSNRISSLISIDNQYQLNMISSLNDIYNQYKSNMISSTAGSIPNILWKCRILTNNNRKLMFQFTELLLFGRFCYVNVKNSKYRYRQSQVSSFSIISSIEPALITVVHRLLLIINTNRTWFVHWLIDCIGRSSN